MKSIARLEIDLSKFGERVIENVKKAQRDTAEVIWQDVIADAPYDTGNYVSSIQISDTDYDGYTIKTSIYTDATVTAKASGNTYNLGRLLEEGTRPHEIRAVDAKGLFWGAYDEYGNPIIVKSVQHPGTVAQPHFIPALNKNVALYKSNINKAIKEAK